MSKPSKPIIGFDLDGTLFHHGGRDAPYHDPPSLAKSTTPHADRCQMVRWLLEDGWRVHFITGRAEIHKPHTLVALHRAISREITGDQLHHQPLWHGYAEMAGFKAWVLNEIGAEAYVGDHWADRQAAELAQVAYYDPDEYFPLPQLVTP